MPIYIMTPNSREKQRNYTGLLHGEPPANINMEQIVSKLLEIRQHSAANINLLAEQLMEYAPGNFHQTIYARDSEEAVQFIANVSKDTSNIGVNRSSTVKELVPGMENKGFNVIRTYEQEYDASKCQPLEDAASLSPEILWRSFGVEAYHIPQNNTVRDYTGVLGTSAMSVDGAIFFLQHFNNIRRVMEEARKIIVVVGLEKLVEKRADAEFQAKCAGIFGLESILQDLSTSQVHHQSVPPGALEIRPSKAEKEIYLLLLDNGRRDIISSAFGDLFYCINCRACTVPCPGYPYFGKEALRSPREYLTDFIKGMESSIKDCIHCGQCSVACPLIDLDTLMLEAEAKKVEKCGLPVRERLLINTILLASTGRKVAPIINRALRNTVIRKAAEKILDIESKSALPPLSAKSIVGRLKK